MNPKVGMYPGSFDPWHGGHDDVLKKALKVFDTIHLIKMFNPDKGPMPSPKSDHERQSIFDLRFGEGRVIYSSWDKLLVDAAAYIPGLAAVIRGLRNGHDLQYEMNMQYWNEDLGLKVPVVYFVTDRTLSHISSSAIRQLDKFKEKNGV